jgi:Family of unknown function (DUF6064)
MTEWWTYRPSDFLLFSARTYYRLFELYNNELWPAQVITVGLGLALWLALRQRRSSAPRIGFLLLGVAWLWVAWAFHWQRFALINWAATGFAVAFAVEGVLLLAWALSGAAARWPAEQGRSRSVGLAVLFFAVALQPGVGLLLGRPLPQAEVFGLAPDPTAMATLALLLLSTSRKNSRAFWLLWPLPLLWCAYAGMTLASMQSADALLLPVAAVLAAAAAVAELRSRAVH